MTSEIEAKRKELHQKTLNGKYITWGDLIRYEELINREARKEFLDIIQKIHNHWHPIDKRGYLNNEKCDEHNCMFRHIEYEFERSSRHDEGGKRA